MPAKYGEVSFFYDSLQKKFVKAEVLYQYFISVKGIKYIFFFPYVFLEKRLFLISEQVFFNALKRDI